MRDLTLHIQPGADVIAIGAIMAVSTCNGPVIPFHAGRVDVWAPQSSNNTPLPEDSIETLRESFRKQGFTPAEMITLTACGHTMGGVRSSDFPQLVSPPTSNSSAPNIKNFDTTTSFDNAV
jgi:catalase (peroxidase I)